MRYLPLTDQDRSEMLGVIGAKSVDDLFVDVPKAARQRNGFDLPAHQGEMAVERTLGEMAGKNTPAGSAPFFLGSGAYRHHVPAAVDHLIQRGEFLTSYTPYQPEISQGTLQYLFEFQTQVALITGMEIANASLYDGASAAGEAVLMARRITRRSRVVLAGNLHPHWADTIAAMGRYGDVDLVVGSPDVKGDEDLKSVEATLDGDTACVVVQNPDAFGHLRDLSKLSAVCTEKGALLIVGVAEPVSLGAVTPPGAMGADIVVGEGQSIGNGLNFGGPYLGLFATKEKFVRQMPGRISGETTDSSGRRGWVLTLSTREQHIRREKATSNICTNSGLCALAFTIHMALLGEAGFRQLAQINHARTVALKEQLSSIKGVEVLNKTFFNEISVRLKGNATAITDTLSKDGILAGVPATRLWPGADGLDDVLILAATETTRDEDIAALSAGLKGVLS